MHFSCQTWINGGGVLINVVQRQMTELYWLIASLVCLFLVLGCFVWAVTPAICTKQKQKKDIRHINRSFKEHLLRSFSLQVVIHSTVLLNLSFLWLSPVFDSLAFFSCLSTSLCQTSFPQYGGLGSVSHSGGPGVWRATCHHQRGLWPPRRRGHPEAGGKDTWVTLCLSIAVSLSVTAHRLKTVT